MTQDLSREIALPIRRFTHPETHSVVTVVGTIHCAQLAYFAQLNKLLADFDALGATIHYEHVGDPTAAEIADADSEIRQGADEIRVRLDAQWQEARSLGLAVQEDDLDLHDHWENHDISRIGAAAFYGLEALTQLREMDKQLRFLQENTPAAVRRTRILESNLACMKVVTGEVSINLVLPGVQRQLATLRECIAMSAVDVRLATNPGTHVVLVWGAAHLPSYSRSLAVRGFKDEGDTWVTAVDPVSLPPLD